MSTIAEVQVPAEEFALRDTFDAVPGATFEVERIVARDTDYALPFIWATDADFEELEAALEADETVEDVELIADLDDEWLYRMEWVASIRLVIRILLVEDATILNAYGSNDRWDLRILFPERDVLSATYDFCQKQGLTLEVQKVYDVDNGPREGRYGLTDEQYEALTTAANEGYFKVPREVTADELADDLGISHQALSERIRRGHENLVRSTLMIDDPIAAE